MSKLTPPGKPSTWFPGEGLVTQAQLIHLLPARALCADAPLPVEGRVQLLEGPEPRTPSRHGARSHRFPLQSRRAFVAAGAFLQEGIYTREVVR